MESDRNVQSLELLAEGLEFYPLRLLQDSTISYGSG